MHFDLFFEELKKNPKKALWGLVPIVIWKLVEHRLCKWANEQLDDGAGPVIKQIRDVTQSAIDHPVWSVPAIASLFCVGLVVFAFISVWIKGRREAQKVPQVVLVTNDAENALNVKNKSPYANPFLDNNSNDAIETVFQIQLEYMDMLNARFLSKSTATWDGVHKSFSLKFDGISP